MDELSGFEDLIINTAMPTNPDPQGAKHHNIEHHNIEQQNNSFKHSE